MKFKVITIKKERKWGKLMKKSNCFVQVLKMVMNIKPAFMPLIAVALVYLVLVVILTKLTSKLERRLRKSER